MKGSFRKRIKADGSVTWVCVIDIPPDPVTGKRRQRRLSAPTRKKLEEEVATALHELATGTFLEPTTVTTGDYLKQWLEVVEPTLRPSSFRRYKGALERQIIPAIGTIRLARLSGAHLQRFYAGRLAAGLSPTTVRLYHGSILHRAFEQAVRWRLLARNPCDDADPPQPATTEMHTWTVKQARSFLAGTADDEHAALWRLALATGMRQGELLGLRWADVDLGRAALAVRRNLTRDRDGALVLGDPKSAAGRRPIALPPSCVAALRRHRGGQAERRRRWDDAWHAADFVFDRGDGRPLHPNVARAAFRRAAARLGLPVIRFHDLRHTAATLALADGVHPKIVQERLGHSDIGMTLDRYSHVTMSMQEEAAARWDRLLGEDGAGETREEEPADVADEE